MSLDALEYDCAAAAVGYAQKMVELECDHFEHGALQEILRWVVLPAGGQRTEPRMFGELLRRAEAAASASDFRRGPYAEPRSATLRAVSSDALHEFARLVREEAFNEFRKHNEQAVRP